MPAPTHCIVVESFRTSLINRIRLSYALAVEPLLIVQLLQVQTLAHPQITRHARFRFGFATIPTLSSVEHSTHGTSTGLAEDVCDEVAAEPIFRGIGPAGKSDCRERRVNENVAILSSFSTHFAKKDRRTEKNTMYDVPSYKCCNYMSRRPLLRPPEVSSGLHTSHRHNGS